MADSQGEFTSSEIFLRETLLRHLAVARPGVSSSTSACLTGGLPHSIHLELVLWLGRPSELRVSQSHIAFLVRNGGNFR